MTDAELEFKKQNLEKIHKAQKIADEMEGDGSLEDLIREVFADNIVRGVLGEEPITRVVAYLGDRVQPEILPEGWVHGEEGPLRILGTKPDQEGFEQVILEGDDGEIETFIMPCE